MGESELGTGRRRGWELGMNGVGNEKEWERTSLEVGRTLERLG